MLLTSVMLITIDLRGNALLDAARAGFDYAFRPFEIAGDVVSRPIARVWAGVNDVDDLQDENRRLQQQLDAQRSDQIAAQNALIENRELRELLNLPTLADYDGVTASLIGGGPSNYDQTVEIDAGTLDGIRVGMTVVSAAGLVGKITQAFPETSIVMLITDKRYHVAVKVVAEVYPEAEPPPVTSPSGFPVDSLPEIAAELSATTTSTTSTTSPFFQTTTTTTTPPSTSLVGGPAVEDPSATPDPGPGGGAAGPGAVSTTTTTTVPEPIEVTRETGLLDGAGGDRLPRVQFISDSPQFGAVEVGDAVLTTGGRSSLAPPGIPIGIVLNSIQRSGTQGLLLEVRPNADLDRLNFVSVILYQPSTELGTG